MKLAPNTDGGKMSRVSRANEHTSTSALDLRDLCSETRVVQLVVCRHRHQHHIAGGYEGQMFTGRIVATHPVGDTTESNIHLFIF